MKVAVATNDNKTVAGHVGRCKAFLIYETEGSKILNNTIRINSFTHHGQHLDHGEEHHRHQGEEQRRSHHNLIEGLKDCEALIFNHGGWRLIEDFKAHNIKPLLTDENFAEDAVLKYLTGDLIVNEENICRAHNH